MLFAGVREFRFFDGDAARWDYTEMTAISATRMTDGSYVVDITTWTDDAGLMIRCDGFEMNQLPLGVDNS